ncbi:MAG: tRNA pseudouridine(55) synthase TruB [Thermodesulfobacteriota bacterium]|nr:tRNA pseudouridine(55) synthase TruB [Thermodesulfobacteriota bacterium]
MNGIVVIDKPSGISSHSVVKKVQRQLRAEKAGHTGTLDPLATGVLPVCLNEATKTVQFLINDDKEYEVGLRLGIETDTQDVTGEVIAESDRIPENQNEIIDVFDRFVGSIQQKPPAFSALKHKGVPLYKLARRGVQVENKERTVIIFSLRIAAIDLPYVSFAVSCSKGTYIRTLCADIGRNLGCGAHLVRLRRTRSGKFRIEDALTIQEVEESVKKGAIEKHVIPMDKALDNLSQIKVNNNMERKIKQGKQILLRDLQNISLSRLQAGEKLRITSFKDDLIAVAESLVNYPLTNEICGQETACRLIRVFNT